MLILELLFERVNYDAWDKWFLKLFCIIDIPLTMFCLKTQSCVVWSLYPETLVII